MMLSVILSLAVLSSAPTVFSFPAAVDQRPSQCVDPTFACQDLKNAKLCNVVKTCIDDIWSTINPPADNNEICDLCKEMVKEARDQLLSNMTQEEIKEVFEGSCKLLPVKVLADACIKVVDEIIVQLVEMLASRMDPNQVCTISGLCLVSDLHISKNVRKFLTAFLQSKHHLGGNNVDAGDELVCEFCSNVLEHIKQLMTANSTVEEFRTALKNFCKYTGRFATECSDLVDKYFDQVIAFISGVDTHSFCTLLGLCTGNETAVPIVNIRPLYGEKMRPMVKLMPAIPVSKNFESFLSPLVKIKPAMNAVKKIRENPSDIEVNDIFDKPSMQLPVERFNKPLVIFERDTECAFCKAISLYLAHDLNGDTSHVAVQNALDNVCEKWVKGFPDHCHSFVKKYSSYLYGHLIKGSDTENICLFIEACSHEPQKVKTETKSPNVQDLECDLCKEFLQEVDEKLKDPKTQESIKETLDSLCSYVPQSFSDQCRNFVDIYSETLINMLADKLDPATICASIKLCTSLQNVKVQASPVGDIECELCKELVQEIVNQLKDQTTEEEIKEALDKVCTYMPASLSEKCKTFVDTYSEMLITLLVQELDPTQICTALKLCPNSSQKMKVKVEAIECDVCKQFVQQIDKQIQDPSTQAIIKQDLDKLCDYLPQEFAKPCSDFVEKYAQIILDLLVQELEPNSICEYLKLCTSSPKAVKLSKVRDMECDLCEQVVGEVDKELISGSTKEEIKQALEKVCSYLPKSYSLKCKNFVDSYSEELIDLLAKDLSPKLVCAALKLCPENKQSREKKLKEENIKCEGCQYVFHFLQTQLMEAETQEQVKNAFKEVCNILPSVYSQNCDAFIDEYGSSLLVLIAQNIDPSIVCDELGVCVNSTISMKKPVVKKVKPLKLNECALCTTVVDYLDKLLEDDDVDKEITALVEKACAYIPSQFKDQCVTLVQTYGPYMLQMLGQIASSKEVCQKITMCSSSETQTQHLLGQKECTFGPSYWCQSHANAVACKAEMYCKQRVWKN